MRSFAVIQQKFSPSGGRATSRVLALSVFRLILQSSRAAVHRHARHAKLPTRHIRVAVILLRVTLSVTLLPLDSR